MVIACNTIGPVLLEHTHGGGYVLIAALINPAQNCVENTVLYVQSLVQRAVGAHLALA